jgi:hypothetical protein
LPDKADDVFRVVRPVRIAANAAPLVFADLVLIDDPFQRAAIGEAILEHLSGNVRER